MEYRGAYTDLRDLIEGVIEMVQHLGKYQDKNLQLLPGEPLIVEVNAQEIKQVVLNLITNASDAIGERKGVIRVICTNKRHKQRQG